MIMGRGEADTAGLPGAGQSTRATSPPVIAASPTYERSFALAGPATGSGADPP